MTNFLAADRVNPPDNQHRFMFNRSHGRTVVMLTGVLTSVVGTFFLLEELTDHLQGQTDPSGVFGALVVLSIGMLLGGAGVFLSTDEAVTLPGRSFSLVTAGTATLAGASAYAIALIVDIDGMGPVVIAAGCATVVVVSGMLVFAVANRRWRTAGVTVVAVGVSMLAGSILLLALTSSGATVPEWVWMLDE